ncbi:hypothetical protein [Hymenobacter psoromatis]|uniref:hypothetical protein n=1 Tax=Hymenobacter psoromatis TaxID=1484116 RepID=UPI001CBD95CA|nr:hypothetical protein [Hymenobacter psoromatis]
MKQLLGSVIGVVTLALAGLLVLRIWNISVVSSATVLRSGATLAVLAATLVGLLMLRFTFFKNPAAGYDPQVGNRAHPRQPANFSQKKD